MTRRPPGTHLHPKDTQPTSLQAPGSRPRGQACHETWGAASEHRGACALMRHEDALGDEEPWAGAVPAVGAAGRIRPRRAEDVVVAARPHSPRPGTTGLGNEPREELVWQTACHRDLPTLQPECESGGLGTDPGCSSGEKGALSLPQSPRTSSVGSHHGPGPQKSHRSPPCFVPGSPISLTSVAGASLLQIPAGIFVLGSPDLGDF